MSNYRGRFAPSPTGPLHFGSLFAAVVSFLHARSQNGKWLLRVEDLDPPREQRNAKASILKTLELHGLEWDGPVVYQSQRADLYEARLAELAAIDMTYLCPCSRKQLTEQFGRHSEACRLQQVQGMACATKFKGQQQIYHWLDEFQGELRLDIHEDFVLKRKDGFYAYQLAVVCDDIEQNISHVVRGYDLLDSTPMQLALCSAFKQPPPRFAHFPVIIQQNGQKLSKQNMAPAVDDSKALSNLLAVYQHLGLVLPDSPASVSEAIEQGLMAWKCRTPAVLGLTNIPE